MDKLEPEQHDAAAMAGHHASDLVKHLAVVRWSDSMSPWQQALHLEWAYRSLDDLTAALAKLPRPEKTEP
jgi:hypothetical protein